MYANPQLKLAWQRRFREENPEKVAAYAEKSKASRAEYRARPEVKARNAEDMRLRYAGMTAEQRKARCLNAARNNAANKGQEFNITVSDLHWPEFCPMLGIRLNYGCPTNGKASWDSPSLDRHDPTMGYVKGNVVVMSWRANALKRDATCEEAVLLAEYMRRTRSN